MRLLPRFFVCRHVCLTDHNWKNDFFVECLTPILEAMTDTKAPPEYPQILALDRTARDFAVPSLLDERDANGNTPRYLVMQRALVIMGREIGASVLFFSF